MKTYTVLLLRRDTLTSDECADLLEQLPLGSGVAIRRIDPANCIEHDRICSEIEAETGTKPIVVLPNEGPIPSLAMKRGVQHITFTPDGVKLLVEVVPRFKIFKIAPETPEIAESPAHLTAEAPAGFQVGNTP